MVKNCWENSPDHMHVSGAEWKFRTAWINSRRLMTSVDPDKCRAANSRWLAANNYFTRKYISLVWLKIQITEKWSTTLVQSLSRINFILNHINTCRAVTRDRPNYHATIYSCVFSQWYPERPLGKPLEIVSDVILQSRCWSRYSTNDA